MENRKSGELETYYGGVREIVETGHLDLILDRVTFYDGSEEVNSSQSSVQ